MAPAVIYKLIPGNLNFSTVRFPSATKGRIYCNDFFPSLTHRNSRLTVYISQNLRYLIKPQCTSVQILNI